MRPEKLTFVCVVYRNDYDLVMRLMSSLGEFFKLDEIEELVLILNEPYNYVSNFQAFLAGIPNFGYKVTTYWSNELWPEQDSYDWYSQQMLKILAAEKVNTSWYVIHDAKDYYIGHTDITHYFDQQGASYGCVNTYDPHKFGSGPGIFNDEYTRAYEIWGLDFRNHKSSFMLKYTTPFPVKTELIRDMIEDLKSRFHGVFYRLLQLQINHKPLYTEFALISAYLTFRGRIAQDYIHGWERSDTFTYRVKQSKDLRRRFV